MKIMVRRALKHEADVLSEIVFRSKQALGYDDAFMEMCRDALRVTPARIENSIVEVAVDEQDRPLGCVALNAAAEEDGGSVHLFFVDPDHQRKGIGRILFEAVMRDAHDAGYAALFLDSDPTAVPFYEAMGFSVVGESPSEAINGRVLPRMRRMV